MIFDIPSNPHTLNPPPPLPTHRHGYLTNCPSITPDPTQLLTTIRNTPTQTRPTSPRKYPPPTITPHPALTRPPPHSHWGPIRPHTTKPSQNFNAPQNSNTNTNQHPPHNKHHSRPPWCPPDPPPPLGGWCRAPTPTSSTKLLFSTHPRGFKLVANTKPHPTRHTHSHSSPYDDPLTPHQPNPTTLNSVQHYQTSIRFNRPIFFFLIYLYGIIFFIYYIFKPDPPPFPHHTPSPFLPTQHIPIFFLSKFFFFFSFINLYIFYILIFFFLYYFFSFFFFIY